MPIATSSVTASSKVHRSSQRFPAFTEIVRSEVPSSPRRRRALCGWRVSRVIHFPHGWTADSRQLLQNPLHLFRCVGTHRLGSNIACQSSRERQCTGRLIIRELADCDEVVGSLGPPDADNSSAGLLDRGNVLPRPRDGLLNIPYAYLSTCTTRRRSACTYSSVFDLLRHPARSTSQDV